MMEITSKMTEAFQQGSGYGGDISQPDVDRGLEAVFRVLEQEPEEHPWQEFNEHGNTCHYPGCTLTEEEHSNG